MTTELTVNGYKLVIGAISPLAPKSLELMYKKKHPEPEKPYYEVEGALGIVEKIPHTVDTLETDAEKKAWAEWEQKHNEWMGGLTYQLLRLFLSQGVTIKLSDEERQSLHKKASMFIEDMPTDDSDLDLLYLETFIINRPEFIEKVISAVLEETGIKEESLEAANALFPA